MGVRPCVTAKLPVLRPWFWNLILLNLAAASRYFIASLGGRVRCKHPFIGSNGGKKPCKSRSRDQVESRNGASSRFSLTQNDNPNGLTDYELWPSHLKLRPSHCQIAIRQSPCLWQITTLALEISTLALSSYDPPVPFCDTLRPSYLKLWPVRSQITTG